MKGKILKKVIAAAVVLTLVTGGMPISPVADLFGGVGIVANANGDTGSGKTDGGSEISPDEETITSISYPDENGQRQTKVSTLITSDITELPSGWYAVNGNIYSSATPSETLKGLTNRTLTPASVKNITVSDCTNGTVTTPENAPVGATVTLTAEPDAGYKIIGAKYNDTEIIPENGVYAFTMPDEDVTITAEFDVESYYDESSRTLTLKGKLPTYERYESGALVTDLILPKNVDFSSVKRINVDPEGAEFPKFCYALFTSFNNVEDIDLKNADTSKVTNMACLFYSLKKLTHVDLTGIDTSKVIFNAKFVLLLRKADIS